jgi:hypothetical protein
LISLTEIVFFGRMKKNFNWRHKCRHNQSIKNKDQSILNTKLPAADIKHEN